MTMTMTMMRAGTPHPYVSKEHEQTGNETSIHKIKQG